MTQEKVSKEADYKTTLEMAEKKVIQLLENMTLSTNDLEREVMNCRIYNKEA